jgi:hypothetical protein
LVAGQAQPPTPSPEQTPSEAVTAGSADTRPVSIAGRVTGPGGKTVEDARVIAVERLAWEEPIVPVRLSADWDKMLRAIRGTDAALRRTALRLPSARSGTEGRYEIRALPEGNYRVAVTHKDYFPITSKLRFTSRQAAQ